MGTGADRRALGATEEKTEETQHRIMAVTQPLFLPRQNV